MKKIVVGVTGKICSGKSTLCRFLQKKGFCYIHVDKIVVDLYKNGESGSKLLQKMFGGEYLKRDGSVDKDKLRGIFKTAKFEKFVKELNVLIVDCVKNIIKHSDKSRFVIEYIDFDNPDFKRIVNEIILVKCPFELTKKRNKKFNDLFLLKAYKSQKINIKTDYVIDNVGKKTDLYRKTEFFLDNLL